MQCSVEAQKATAETRKRKLAAIRSFLKFLKDNQIIFGNPAETVEGPIREEKEPAILLKTEYKALLQVAGDNPRNFAIVMLFLQSGLRVSELVNLKVQDVDGYFYPTPRKGKNKGLLISEEFITYCFNWSQCSWHPLAEGQNHPRKFWPLCDNLSELSAYCTMIFA